MIDTHAHLFHCTRSAPEIVTNAQNAGLTAIINVAITLDTAKQCIQTAKEHDMIFATAGIYPGETQDKNKMDELEALITSEPIVAIGEIGLDYFKVDCPRETQITMFETQLELARKHHLPVIIHNRHADEDHITIAKNFPDVKKVFHCFGSNTEFVDQTINDNTYYSFTATVTYAKKGKTINSLRHIPLEKIMIETDCPYLLPQNLRNTEKENQPSFVLETAKRIAEVKEIPLNDVIATTTANAISFFNLSL